MRSIDRLSFFHIGNVKFLGMSWMSTVLVQYWPDAYKATVIHGTLIYLSTNNDCGFLGVTEDLLSNGWTAPPFRNGDIDNWWIFSYSFDYLHEPASLTRFCLAFMLIYWYLLCIYRKLLRGCSGYSYDTSSFLGMVCCAHSHGFLIAMRMCRKMSKRKCRCCEVKLGISLCFKLCDL